jgi:archaellum component FlaC
MQRVMYLPWSKEGSRYRLFKHQFQIMLKGCNKWSNMSQENNVQDSGGGWIATLIFQLPPGSLKRDITEWIDAMRETVALLVFLAIAGPAILLAIKKRIGNPLTVILLVFSLISGWGIANYDWVKKVQFQPPGLSDFQKQVAEIKQGAVDELKKEAEDGKESFKRLASSVELTGALVEKRKNEIDGLADAMNKSGEEMKAQEEKIEKINANFSELALLLTKVAWLQFQALGEPQSNRARAATQKIMDSLDEIVAAVIPDPQARAQFVSNLFNSLPAQQ